SRAWCASRPGPSSPAGRPATTRWWCRARWTLSSSTPTSGRSGPRPATSKPSRATAWTTTCRPLLIRRSGERRVGEASGCGGIRAFHVTGVQTCALPIFARVVRVAARPVVTGWEAGDDEVVVQGAVDFVIIYAHEREEWAEARDIKAEPGYGLDDDVSAAFDPVEYREVLYRHRWRRGGVFEAVLDVPGAHPGATVEVAAFPEDMDVQLHHDGRGVDVE